MKEELKQLEELTFLQRIISEDGRSRREIINRIFQAKTEFNKNRGLFTSRCISMHTRKNLLKTFVWSIILNSSKMWTITKIKQKIIKDFET